MRVLIDTTYAARAPRSGTGVYIRRLVEALEREHHVEVVQAVNRRRRPPAGGGLGSARNLVSDLGWSMVELPSLARRRKADVIHHPLPVRSLHASRAQVVTVVDLAFERLPGCFDRGFRTYAHFSHRAAARRADMVVAISETTAADVRELWGVDPERIIVAPLGPGQDLDRRADAAPAPGGVAAGTPSESIPRHFLYVGDDEPRKNLRTLLAAHELYRSQARSPLPLVLAGTAAVQADGVAVERSPSPERLSRLYAEAAALIQPSLYEGFGLTALEAMSVGTPVLAARSPGLLEVCADAAVWADATDAASFASGMSALATDGSLRAQMTALGRRRADDFSWAACARAHVRAYSLALSRSGS